MVWLQFPMRVIDGSIQDSDLLNMMVPSELTAETSVKFVLGLVSGLFERVDTFESIRFTKSSHSFCSEARKFLVEIYKGSKKFKTENDEEHNSFSLSLAKILQ